jgi:DNA-binding response OmpR family regulator
MLTSTAAATSVAVGRAQPGRGDAVEPIRVLIIDDDEQITSFLRRALTYAGFAVATAGSGEAGLQRARIWSPEVVVLDLWLPDLDGLTVYRRLRADGPTPVLMLSAHGLPPDLAHGPAGGPDGFLPKPFALADLIARLHALARR